MSSLTVHREPLAPHPQHGAAPAQRILLRLVGDADIDHAVELAAALDGVRKESPRLVVLDLSGLAFISSMGIGTLFTFAHAMAKLGGEARLAAPNENVGTALERCRANQIMKIFPTVAAASV